MQSTSTITLIKFFAMFGLLVAFTSGVEGIPTKLAKRDEWNPIATSPTSGTHWYTGQTQNVTWETTDHPVNITNKLGRIFLRKDNLTTPLYLANNFDVLSGSVEVTVPWVISGDDYQINLQGDSEDFSAYFSIN